MASIFDKQNEYERARTAFWQERQEQAYARAAQITEREKQARAEWFATQTAEPRDVTLTLTRSTAEWVIAAVLACYEEYRYTMPTDATCHYGHVLDELRREHEDLFPVYDTSD